MAAEEKTSDYQKVTFRDRMSTVDNEGKRVWVFPQMPKGKLYNYRRVVAYTLLAFFYLAPHLKIKGEQLVFLNFLERKFVLFGNTFYPQDFHLLVLAFITLLVFIILFTVVYGRIFCGWTCPQTVFLEFLYRPIEYLIDGNRRKQQVLAQQPMNLKKLSKRLLKHGIYLAISFGTIITFWSYLIGYPNVLANMSGWPGSNFSSLLVVLAFTAAHYYVFAWFREQVCSLVCPYGRLQGVMLDQNSIVVAYDYVRGEPRGRGRNEDKGDCIDCKRCVDVCPTGIDIRNGTQLECINCTACIDACNSVMYAVNKPKGLIRYASERSISESKKHVLNTRAIAYSVVLVILLAVVSYSFMNRGDVETTIIRAQGTLFQEYGADAYSNLYNLQMVNKTSDAVQMELKLLTPDGEIKLMGDELNLEVGKVAKRNLLIILPKNTLSQSNTHLVIGVYEDGELLEEIKSTFVGPNSLDNE
ncbi:cytochrome c oxidase accessory protein CcoG [Sunxiuqinia elliptica]|uniref:Cytochrome c oxidase accessory protein FixG n=1 Tax=Sunxiuqinia elliptica TaxID=655355 RepID=A0A1I2K7L3_9BACT|nr:cytochrome c oxidase accessory protein CcoG [Sunxiuqinia elliptica]SFF63112.1 cytochrome c oxidase accessory protein FixG [Sunxiuqinia elliptica]